MAMKTHSTLLAILLGGALAAGTAFAQDGAGATDTADPAATETTEPAPAEADATTETTAGTDADADGAEEPAIGNFYIKEAHGDWQLRCVRTPDGSDPCEMFQLLRDEAGNAVAEATLIPLAGEQVAAGMTITAPLESDLSTGVGMQIDSGEARAYPFAVCTEVGCVSRIGLTAGELDAMRRGAKGTVYVQPFGMGQDAQVQLPLSLTGFTAGFAALSDYVAELGAAAGEADEAPEAPAAD